MYSSKENLTSPSYFKSPYTRMNQNRIDSTLGKIISKPRTVENNYLRSSSRSKLLTLQSLHLNSNDHSQHNDAQLAYGELDLYRASYDVTQPQDVNQGPERFRPRQSLRREGNRTRRNIEALLDMETMDVGNNADSSKMVKNKTNGQDVSAKGNFQIKNRENTFRLFTGSVENILQWSKLRNAFQLLFEVTATLDEVNVGGWTSEKVLYVSDSKTGLGLQVVYYEIDRPLPKLTLKSMVTCVGRLLARNKLQAYKIEQATEERKTESQRLAFICNRVAEEIATSSQKK